ncbi:MAG: dephospho-CoA kinase [Desulfobacteraceae bacterium]|nr:dephospho-CoA kinase [Desulfobacteraceae bacterium]MDH3573927.1 dephospho-CoA kinase [Desulfobacteraceae bacterium]MDH3837560.1 dephospho-CoA kinase [Desulfobacteraceae bacterium]MDH3874046.1 dephospho-CoA kinase [Desulfobacteraceae bacterium]MDH3956496.1 dephospho-CoA kinase [Desulfobacteraceae bacterium]
MNKTKIKILKIAVTGGAGSGKTSVCNRLKKLGVKVISADEMARDAVAPGSKALAKIIRFFGEKVVLSDGTLNRKILRRMITDDDDARLNLERFLHHEITELIQKNVVCAEKEGCQIVVIEVPLLFELDMKERFDRVVVVSADKELRVKRLMERDQTSRDAAENLINVQMPDEEKVDRADYVLWNESSMEKLVESVDVLFKNLTKVTKR